MSEAGRSLDVNDLQDNEQTRFWRGPFGKTYTQRNLPTDDTVRARCVLWSRIMASFGMTPPERILEVGANVGTNLRALRTMTNATLYGVEPNAHARECLIGDGVVPEANVFDAVASSLPFDDGFADTVFTSGVLIHIHPDDLLTSCAEIHRVSSRYIVSIEYFSDKPEEVPYAGETDKLFKRDFGSYWLDNFDDLRILDYGFAWKRYTRLDNLTWWAFEKK